MADKDLQRIVEDLRKQRQLLAKLDDTSLSPTQRKALRDEVERLRERRRSTS